MIGADDVDTLVFDVLGTVVDEAGSMRAELAAALDRAGAPRRSADDLNAEALAGILAGGPALPAATVPHLALAGHRLRAWPDTREALRRLAGRFTIVALSNGNLSMLTDLFAAAGLTWHCALSGELVHARKPDPAVYRLAVERLALDPPRTSHGGRPLLRPACRRSPRAAHRLHPGRRRRRARSTGRLRPHSPRPGGPPRAAAYRDATTVIPASELCRSTACDITSKNRGTREMRHYERRISGLARGNGLAWRAVTTRAL